MFEAETARFAAFVKIIDSYRDALRAIGENRPPEPRWDQVWFPRLDACAAYTMVREAKPARIVEIGAGHSTRFMVRAIRDVNLATGLIAFDPAPRASLAGLHIDLITARAQDASLPALASGDILFVDSSHVHEPGSDVAHVMEKILPTLSTGTLVHFHDIFLPDPYPPEWAGRRYSEQAAVAALLAAGGYEVLFASHFVATRMADVVARSVVAELPLQTGAFENSLWLRKRQPL